MNPSDTPDFILECRPIGFARTDGGVKFSVPHQPDRRLAGAQGYIELVPHHNFEMALRDLNGFDWIWLLWAFHRNKTWRPMVLPPRGPHQRRGVFATRSPHRPNPIGLTAVPLLAIEGRQLHIGAHDLVDGTPILDIKPYISDVDSIPSARRGWLTELESELANSPRYDVTISSRAQEQCAWLRAAWGIDFLGRAQEILSRDPTPHRTRRITRTAPEGYRMGCGAWRLYFTVTGQVVTINEIAPGYPERLLHSPEGTIPDRDAQVAFASRYPR